jgi:hypothetical protein
MKLVVVRCKNFSERFPTVFLGKPTLDVVTIFHTLTESNAGANPRRTNIV